MSKAIQFLKEECAVSNVMGIILMVAITVILAAIAASYLNVGPSEPAPVSSIRLVVVSGDDITLQHQGGEAIDLSDTSITVSQGDSVLKITKVNSTADLFMFEGGDILNVDAGTGFVRMNDVNTNSVISGSGFNITSPSSNDVKVLVIDIPTGQIIANMNYNV